MKDHQIQSCVSTPRRRLFGAVAGAVAGLFGWKLGNRTRTSASSAAPDWPAAEASAPAQVPSTNPIVVKTAPRSVKRHG